MNIKSMSVLLASVLFVGLASCDNKSTAPEGSANTGGKSSQVLTDGCLTAFEGITSCPIGTASLSLSPEGRINVNGLTDDGGSGISSSFANAVDWSQDADLDFPVGGSVNYDAVSNGDVVSSARVTRTGDASLQFDMTFTGAADQTYYDVDIYNNGVPVGGQARLIPGRGGVTTQPQLPGCWVWMNTHFKDKQGRCIWDFRWVQPCNQIVFHLPDGRDLIGDQVVFTEHVDSGHYPYNNFQEINVTTNATLYSIFGESTVAAE